MSVQHHDTPWDWSERVNLQVADRYTAYRFACGSWFLDFDCDFRDNKNNSRFAIDPDMHPDMHPDMDIYFCDRSLVVTCATCLVVGEATT